jgi:hypothetical protein
VVKEAICSSLFRQYTMVKAFHRIAYSGECSYGITYSGEFISGWFAID